MASFRPIFNENKTLLGGRKLIKEKPMVGGGNGVLLCFDYCVQWSVELRGKKF